MQTLYHLENNGVLHDQRTFMREEQNAVRRRFDLADDVSLIRVDYMRKDVALFHLVAALAKTAVYPRRAAVTFIMSSSSMMVPI